MGLDQPTDARVGNFIYLPQSLGTADLAKAEIYRLIDALANEGLAIMLISSELPEVMGMSDRIIVMQGGRITGELPGPGATEERVLELAMHEHLKSRRAAAEAAAAGGEKE